MYHTYKHKEIITKIMMNAVTKISFHVISTPTASKLIKQLLMIEQGQ